jgi:hypothetical protein
MVHFTHSVEKTDGGVWRDILIKPITFTSLESFVHTNWIILKEKGRK